jgi:tetratricopeptide (TPR) repeat protein
MAKPPSSDQNPAGEPVAPSAGSVYHREKPQPKRRSPGRRGPPSSTPSKRRGPNLGHAIMVSNIRTFTLVAVVMFGLLALALTITGRVWQARQERVETGEVSLPPRTPRALDTESIRQLASGEPTTPDLVRAAAESGSPQAFVRAELDTEAMRRAVFMQKQGEVAVEQGDYTEAINRFHDALDIWPRLTQVWSQLGQVYLAVQDYPRARIALERAVENDPGNPELLNDLGVALLYLNQLEEALQLFETVNDIDADFDQAYFNRSLVLLAREDAEAAEVALDAFLRLAPTDARGLKEKAFLQASRREYGLAMETLRQALASRPDWAALHIDLAATAALMGRVEEALNALDKAEAFTSPSTVYQLYQEPAFREIRLTEAGRAFESQLAARAREILEAASTGDTP